MRPAARRLLLSCLFTVEALLCYVLVAQRFPLSGDDYSYLYQAQLFAEGRLYAESPLYDDAHPLHACIAVNCLRDDGGRRFSKYAPGWPLLLAGGVALGVPWLVGPLLGGALVYLMLWHVGQRRAPGIESRVWVLATACAFLAYYAASYRAHMATALFVFAAYVVRERTSGPPDTAPAAERTGLLVAGALLGCSSVIRYVDWVPLGLWIGVPLLRRRRAADLLVFAGGFVALASANLAYNAAIAGNALTPPTNVPAGAGLHDQLQLSWEGVRVTAARLGLLLWVFPPAIVLARNAGRVGARGRAFVLLFAMQVAVYFLYPTAIAGPGPRYLLPYLPFLLLAVADLHARTRQESPRRANRVWRWMIAVQLAASIVFLAREAHTLYWRRDLERTLSEAHRAGVHNRIVVLRTGTYRTDRADLVRNPPDLASSPSLVVAGCDPETLEAFVGQFPGRQVLAYEYPGRLTPIGAGETPARGRP